MIRCVKKLGGYIIMRKFLLGIFGFVFSVLSFGNTITGKVVKVADGDTITVLQNKKKIRVRFYGIDAPEKSQEYGVKSLDILKKMVENKEVKVEVKDRDQYGRTVGIVYCGDVNVNKYMLETGNAWWYKKIAANEKEFEAAQEKAKSEKLGLWKDSNPTPPWQYRYDTKKKNKK